MRIQVNLYSLPHSTYIYTQYESKRIKDLILKGKILTILQNDVESQFYYLGLWQDL